MFEQNDRNLLFALRRNDTRRTDEFEAADFEVADFETAWFVMSHDKIWSRIAEWLEIEKCKMCEICEIE